MKFKIDTDDPDMIKEFKESYNKEMTKKAKTPNYPKEIEAKMTKEKPLSDGECSKCNGKGCIRCSAEYLPLSEKAYRDGTSLLVEDVALAVKRLKGSMRSLLLVCDGKAHLDIYELEELIDEIFGSFDDNEQKEDKKT